MVGVIRINVLCIVLVTSSMIFLRWVHRQSVGPIEPVYLNVSVLLHGVDFKEGGKPEYAEENPQST